MESEITYKGEKPHSEATRIYTSLYMHIQSQTDTTIQRVAHTHSHTCMHIHTTTQKQHTLLYIFPCSDYMIYIYECPFEKSYHTTYTMFKYAYFILNILLVSSKK